MKKLFLKADTLNSYFLCFPDYFYFKRRVVCDPGVFQGSNKASSVLIFMGKDIDRTKKIYKVQILSSY